jgi:hypothetical protein
VLIILAIPFRLVTTESTAIEIPRLKSIAFIPAATDLHPSVNIAFVKTVAQVVPEIIGHKCDTWNQGFKNCYQRSNWVSPKTGKTGKPAKIWFFKSLNPKPVSTDLLAGLASLPSSFASKPAGFLGWWGSFQNRESY